MNSSDDEIMEISENSSIEITAIKTKAMVNERKRRNKKYKKN